jgi:hypothetical protein
MKKFTYIILSLVIATIMSCKSTNTTKQKNQSISFKEILSGSNSNIFKASNMIIRSQDELETIYTSINKTILPKHDIPKIDFTKEIVIGLFMGSRNSSGYAIEIDKVQSEKEQTSIYIKKTSPSGMVTSVMTQPFYLAKMDKPNTPIKFITN